MSEKPMEKQFWKYVIPSMITMLLGGFYAIIDGLFIGRYSGDIGLAAINIAWPITALILATGVGIGVGGSVILSTRRGSGNVEEAKKAIGNSIFMLILSTLILTVILVAIYPILLRFFGAEGEVYDSAVKYIQVIIVACGLQVFGTGLTPLLRNSSKSILAMAIMITGLVANIILDAFCIMVLNLGLFGAALATVMSQGLVAVLCIITLFYEKETRIKWRYIKPDISIIKEMIKVGMAPFGLSISPSVVIMLANWQCLRYGGGVAVAAYSVISYTISPVQYLLQGVGEGVQPLISYCKGAEEYKSMKLILKKAINTVIILSVVLMVVLILGIDYIPIIFGSSSETASIIETALIIYSTAFPFIGIVRLASAYFYAVENSRFASILVYTDPLIITPILITALPIFLELNGIWVTLPIVQGILTITSVFMFKQYLYNNENNKNIIDYVDKQCS